MKVTFILRAAVCCSLCCWEDCLIAHRLEFGLYSQDHPLTFFSAMRSGRGMHIPEDSPWPARSIHIIRKCFVCAREDKHQHICTGGAGQLFALSPNCELWHPCLIYCITTSRPAGENRFGVRSDMRIHVTISRPQQSWIACRTKK